jgi:hypothetical protein
VFVPAPVTLGVKLDVVIASTETDGDAIYTDFPAKKVIVKFPDAAVGPVAAENGGGVAPVLYAICSSPAKLLPFGVPKTSKIAVPALPGAVLR